MVRSWWMGYNANGSFSDILVAKLKAFKYDLKNWNIRGF